MDPRALDHLLTKEEERAFNDDGYFVMEDALPPELVQRYKAVTKDVVEEYKAAYGIPADRYHGVIDFIGQRDDLLTLVDWYRTLPKVWGILGPDIKLYHTVGMQTPPTTKYTAEQHDEWINWHTDTGNLTRDITESVEPPRISLKVGYVLTDTSEPNMGNFTCFPGSHKSRTFPGKDRARLTDDAVQVCAPAGSAIIFDRRLWHSPTLNTSGTTRYMIFNGYSYRWLANRDDMRVRHFMHRATPIQRQLLGHSNHGAYGSSNSYDDDLPLKFWILDNAPEFAERWPPHP
jgi:ectoine hydroxylase-related dioxygenase (phytanoyl-CoA dioxygenase family)